MKMDIEKTITPQAAGPARMTAGIVPGERQASGDFNLPSVAVLACGEGRTVQFILSTAEARALGEVLLVCGAVAEGGSPPVLQRAPASPIILNGGRA